MRFLTTLILAICLLTAISSTVTPDYYNIGEQIVSSDTNDVEVIFRNLNGQNNQQLLYIYTDEDNTGTIQFSAGYNMDWLNDSTPPTYTYYPWPAGSKIPLTINNGYQNLHYKASGGAQIFVVYN